LQGWISKMSQILREETSEGFVHALFFSPAYDRVAQGGGRHGMEMEFHCSRGKVHVIWRIMPQFFLKETREIYKASGWKEEPFEGLGDISYHSPFAQYEGQEVSHNCSFTGGDCFSGSAYLASGELFNKVVAEPEVLWLELEKRVKEIEEKNKQEQENERNFS